MTIKTNHIYTGNCLDVLETFKDNYIDSIVTDPPYGISFCNHAWDKNVPDISVWQQALRVLKPGGHLVAFSSPRTYHTLTTNIEAAGFDIRDQIMWLYGSGFPRSHNIALTIERNYGATEAKNWRGWGTTLKPAHEPIVIARKPFIGSVADNILAHGTGGLNVDASRVQAASSANVIPFKTRSRRRFPANIVHTNIDEPWTPYFYCAKPSKTERDKGLDSFTLKQAHERARCGKNTETKFRGAGSAARNFHPTVKPIALMEHLIKLITPTGGIVLDPFTGSGSTLVAAKKLNHPYIGIELDESYTELANARLAA